MSTADVSLTDERLNSIVIDIVTDLQTSMLGFHLRKTAELEVTKSNVWLTDIKAGVAQTLTKSGWEKRLRNAVYQYLQTYNPKAHPMAAADHSKEPISYIRRAQVSQVCGFTLLLSYIPAVN